MPDQNKGETDNGLLDSEEPLTMEGRDQDDFISLEEWEEPLRLSSAEAEDDLEPEDRHMSQEDWQEYDELNFDPDLIEVKSRQDIPAREEDYVE